MPTRSFGSELKRWRRHRGLSQLALAAEAQVSQRHVSFLESGRSRPSREMVVHLGYVLDIPPREQNLLLTSAGHAPAFTETPLDEMDGIVEVLDFMLKAHEPNLAFVVDRRWDVVRANGPALQFISQLFDPSSTWAVPPFNLMRASLHPDGTRRHMRRWEATAASLLRRLERDVASHPNDRQLNELLDEVYGYPDVENLSAPAASEAGDLLVPATYLVDDKEISLFTTISIIGDAHDLTLAELRLETLWPVDAISATMLAEVVRVG